MDNDTIIFIFPIALALILIIGYILWKTGNEGEIRKERGRNIIYGPLSKPLHGTFAKVFEKKLSKREKIGWLVVVSLMILALLADLVAS
jgi:hypothetical protein